jgi:putative membrane protein
MFESLLWSLTFRPYVTIFLFAFLALSYFEQGALRTLLWLLTGYLIAFAAEWSSINHGIPFGWYAYNAPALTNDLMVLGVPFFDSLSFSFLSYVSFSFAQFFMSPLWIRPWDVQRVTSREIRNGAGALILGSVLMVITDLIIDPIALLGRHWTLGDIYHYPEPGLHFGVPLANYAGWFVVAATTLWINQRLDEYLVRTVRRTPTPAKDRRVPLQGLLAPLFWTGIVLFQLAITVGVGASGNPGIDRERLMLQALTGAFMVLPILTLAALQLAKPSNRASTSEIAVWRQENGAEAPFDTE